MATKYEVPLQRAHDLARQALANPDHSDQKRNAVAAEARAAGLAEARRMAAADLKSSRARVESARESLKAAEDITADATNWTKVLAMQGVLGAEVRLARDWEGVDALVENYSRDAEALKVLGTSGRLALTERIHTPMDALAARPQNIATFERVVGERAQALEPDGLKRARAELATAQQNATEIERAVRATNHTWSVEGTPLGGGGALNEVLGEGMGPFASKPGSVTYRVKGSPETYSTAAEMFAAAEAMPAGGGASES